MKFVMSALDAAAVVIVSVCVVKRANGRMRRAVAAEDGEKESTVEALGNARSACERKALATTRIVDSCLCRASILQLN